MLPMATFDLTRIKPLELKTCLRRGGRGTAAPAAPSVVTLYGLAWLVRSRGNSFALATCENNIPWPPQKKARESEREETVFNSKVVLVSSPARLLTSFGGVFLFNLEYRTFSNRGGDEGEGEDDEN